MSNRLSQKAWLLKVLSDRRGVKIWLCELLSNESMTLDQLYTVIVEEFGITKVAIEKHLRELEKDGIVFQEERYQDWNLTCPGRMKDLLDYLGKIAPQILNTTESNRSAYRNFKDFVVSRGEEQERVRPLLNVSLDHLFVEPFSNLHAKLKLAWIRRVTRSDVKYDFGRLRQKNGDTEST